MAYANSRLASFSVRDRVLSVVETLKDAMGRRRTYARTLHELSALSDRDLTDLGLSRANIHQVAREAAYMK